MDAMTYVTILKKYKKCPQCGASYNTSNLYSTVENEIITIGCKCGWEIKVNENNERVD